MCSGGDVVSKGVLLVLCGVVTSELIVAYS